MRAAEHLSAPHAVRRHVCAACIATLASGAAATVGGLIGLAVPQAARATAPAGGASPGHPWLPQSRRVGRATLRMLGFSVYDVALYALPDFEATAYAAHPLVLEIRYRRAIAGADIADYSLKEMRHAGAVDEVTAGRWALYMRSAFPDVKDGDRLAGLWQPAAGLTRFAANDGAAVELQDATFGPRFFGIWLAPQTPRPELREQLLGLKAVS